METLFTAQEILELYDLWEQSQDYSVRQYGRIPMRSFKEWFEDEYLN